MKTEPKTFDCLKFKEEAQQAIREATAGMTAEQEAKWFETRAKEGPFKELVKRVEASQQKRRKKAAA